MTYTKKGAEDGAIFILLWYTWYLYVYLSDAILENQRVGKSRVLWL